LFLVSALLEFIPRTHMGIIVSGVSPLLGPASWRSISCSMISSRVMMTLCAFASFGGFVTNCET
jgi:hypothetical protein